MAKIRDLLTVWLCKIVYKIMRLRGSHGAALPGLIAEKLDPNLIRKLTELPDGVIVVSGTNGKTTTTHLVSEVLRRMGKRVFTNHSGSNMTRGILASIVRFSDLGGSLPYDVAVLEIDEAYAAKLAPVLKPSAVILTNVFRDQLDRFGEIDHTANLLKELASHCTGYVVYNATDKRLETVPKVLSTARPVSFGFSSELSEHFPDDDALYSIEARRLPEELDYALTKATDTICTINYGSLATIDRSGLPGWHNALNLTAVYALVTEMYGSQGPQLFTGLKPPYGRGEVIELGQSKLTLQLVKNPNGFRTAMGVEPDQPALVIINDNIADSRDVSWLWDVDVDTFGSRPSVSVSGSRAYDMAVRLHYAEISTNDIDTNIANAIKKFAEENTSGVLFLTYTAMLQSRKIIKSLQGGVK